IPKKSICAMPPRRRATSKARADSPSLQAATRAPVLLAVRCAPRRIARPVNDNREIDFTFDASRPVLSRLPFAAALWSLDRRRCALNHGAHRLLGFGAEDFLRCALGRAHSPAGPRRLCGGVAPGRERRDRKRVVPLPVFAAPSKRAHSRRRIPVLRRAARR